MNFCCKCISLSLSLSLSLFLNFVHSIPLPCRLCVFPIQLHFHIVCAMLRHSVYSFEHFFLHYIHYDFTIFSLARIVSIFWMQRISTGYVGLFTDYLYSYQCLISSFHPLENIFLSQWLLEIQFFLRINYSLGFARTSLEAETRRIEINAFFSSLYWFYTRACLKQTNKWVCVFIEMLKEYSHYLLLFYELKYLYPDEKQPIQ